MSPEEFASRTYDFIIAGGGTAGLTLAARLSEDENVTVGVIEAGGNCLNDPLVSTPGMFMQLWDKPQYDWAFHTVPQAGNKHANNRIHGWIRGRCLGGSSAVNFMMFSHPSKQDLDNWVELGDKGWGWDDLVPYFRKFEKFNPPSEKASMIFDSRYVDPLLRGSEGPLQISFCENDLDWLQQIWPETCRNLGYPEPKDPRSGSALGGFNQLTTVDPKTATRSYAATAFYAPNASRTNLHVITDALVSKVVLEKLGTELTATGVEFSVDGKPYLAKAKKEVIVCGGAIQSPQILELSGIGSRDVLERNGVEVLLDRPNVGENLQDHLVAPFVWVRKKLQNTNTPDHALTIPQEAADGTVTLEALKDPTVVQQVMDAYTSAKAGPLANSPTATAFVPYQVLAPSIADVPSHIRKTTEAATPTTNTPASQLSILERQLVDPGEAAVQLVALATGADASKADKPSTVFSHEFPGNYVVIGACSTHPFSRGSVHIKSDSSKDYPAIGPAYLAHPVDVNVLAHAVMHLQEVAKTEPFASKLKSGPDGNKIPIANMRVPKTLEEAKEHVRAHCITEYHPMGICAMLPKESGGVVDTDLKVYGTTNLRVCDASVFPMHVQGNIQCMVYAVAEKAADVIKAQHRDGMLSSIKDAVGGVVGRVKDAVTNGVNGAA